MRIFSIALLSGLLTLTATSHAQENLPLKVLVIQSYHPSMLWAQSIQQGIEKVLTEAGPARIESFYMDTKFYRSSKYLEEIEAFFLSKYENKAFDLIITADDAAYLFSKKIRSNFTNNPPLAFCGVNRASDESPPVDEKTGGIIEDIDIASTVKIILKLQPDLESLYVINDNTLTGRFNRRILDALAPSWPNLRMIHLDALTWDSLEGTILAISNQSAILLLSHTTDSEGVSLSYRESIARVKEVARVPLYGVWDFFLGRGIVGGMLTSGFDQGRAVARIGLKLLEEPQVILEKSSNRLLFDARELNRHGIRRSLLPPGASLINQSEAWLARHGASLFVGSLLAGVFGFLLLKLRKSQRNLAFLEVALKVSQERNQKFEERLSQQARDFAHDLKKKAGQVQETLSELAKDAEACQRLQFQLLPKSPWRHGEISFRHTLHPSRYLSGDFIDYFEIDADHTGVYIADVSGHGLPSAFIAIYLKGMITQALEKYRSGTNRLVTNPAKLLHHLNQELLKQKIDKHITIFYGIIEHSTSQLTAANAGQFPYPILASPGLTRYIEKAGLPIGLFDFGKYSNISINLPQDFALILTSDGILEIIPDKDLSQKELTLLEAARFQQNDLLPATILKRLAFKQGEPLPDDITILVVQRE